MNIPSKILEQAVEQIASLPGIGKKTALRLALSMLKRDETDLTRFSEAILHLKTRLKRCKICSNISDSDICQICNNPQRDGSIVCVVEDIRDVMAIEATGLFKGLYHILGGIISPMDGIGPGELTIDKLIKRAESGEVKEIILALSTTMEGDTTAFFISKKIKDKPVQLTTIARGVSLGDELEYIDELTLGKSIQNRIPYQDSFAKKT